MSNRHTRLFTATAADIDELGHVNNAVWVEWIQAIAVEHWEKVASAEEQAALIWVVTRHEIDYRGNIGAGESVTGETFIPAPPTGARFDRRVDFRPVDAPPGARPIVSARTTWALIDRASGRLRRVPDTLAARFSPFRDE